MPTEQLGYEPLRGWRRRVDAVRPSLVNYRPFQFYSFGVVFCRLLFI